MSATHVSRYAGHLLLMLGHVCDAENFTPPAPPLSRVPPSLRATTMAVALPTPHSQCAFKPPSPIHARQAPARPGRRAVEVLRSLPHKTVEEVLVSRRAVGRPYEPGRTEEGRHSNREAVSTKWSQLRLHPLARRTPCLYFAYKALQNKDYLYRFRII